MKRGQHREVKACESPSVRSGLRASLGKRPALRAAILRPRFPPAGCVLEGPASGTFQTTGKPAILKVESEFGRIGSRRDEVGSAKRRQEVIQCDFIGEVEKSLGGLLQCAFEDGEALLGALP
jgi:hypothetical protein